MFKQTTKKEAVINQVFTVQNIVRAKLLYSAYTEKYLEELQVALMNADKKKEMELKNKLQQVSKNLSELNSVKVPNFSFQDVIVLTAPARRADIKKNIEEKVFSEKNVKQSLEMYQGYVDIYLDNLSRAKASGNKEEVDSITRDLVSLSENIKNISGKLVLS